MDEKLLMVIIILSVYIIISVMMDFKIKNFVSEKYNNIVIIATNFAFIVLVWFGRRLIDEIYNSFVLFLIPIAIFGTYIILKKNKTYCFKGIDKVFVKENKNEISKIIKEYKNYNLDDKSEIFFENNNITFSKVNKSQIEECLLLIGNYLDENREEYTIKDYLTYYTKTIIAPVVIAVAVVLILNKNNSYNSKIVDVEQINIENDFTVGNTEGNINNYGLVAETAESIYYANDIKLYKSDKDLENETVLVVEPGNLGKDTINVVNDWIFYRQGKEIKRARTDGTNIDTIYRGYSLHMQVVGNWIYFISLGDDRKICRIDVNGQNKEFLRNEEVDDMAIYDGKIYYSYKNQDDVYLEVINTDRTGLQRLANIKTRNMIVDEEYIYYLDDVEEILYRMSLEDKSIEKLSNEQILKFIKDDNWIFYTLKDPNNSDWRYKGLFRMNVDGSNLLALDSESYLDEEGFGVTEDYVFYVATDGKVLPSLKIINKDGTSVK